MSDEKHLCTHCGFNECMYHEYYQLTGDRSIDICKLGMYNVPEKEIDSYGYQGSIYWKCPCFVKPTTKNKITMLGMRKTSMVLLDRIKEHPMEFIDRYLGMNTNKFQRFILKKIIESSIKKGNKNGNKKED